jgi:hypothetical protein
VSEGIDDVDKSASLGSLAARRSTRLLGVKSIKRFQRFTATVLALLFLLFAGRVLWTVLSLHRSVVGGLVLVSVAASLGVGMLMNRPFALRGGALICVLLALALPIGLFSPFSVGDYLAEGHQPPSVTANLLWMVPLILLLLLTAYIVDPRDSRAPLRR